MSWLPMGQITGIERDDDVIAYTAQGTSTITCETTYNALGADRCVKLPYNTAASKAIGRFSVNDTQGITSNAIVMFTIAIGGGATTSDAGIISTNTQGGARYVRAHSGGGTIGIYDSSGTKWLESVSTWSTSALTRFYVMFDTLIDTGKVTIAIWNDKGVLEGWISTGVSRGTFLAGIWTFGEWLPAATSRGADLYGGVIAEYSLTANDNPLWQRYRVLNVTGGGQLPPAADGSFSEWTGAEVGGGTDAANTAYQNVDDANAPTSHPGHDSDTSYNGMWDGTGSGNGLRQTQQYTASNPLVSTDTVAFVELGSAIKATGGSKVTANGMLYDGANTIILDWFQPSTSYVGTKGVSATNPAGNAWAVSDFNLSGGKSTLEFGARTFTVGEASGATVGGRQTDQCGPVIVYQKVEEWLGTLPTGAQY